MATVKMDILERPPRLTERAGVRTLIRTGIVYGLTNANSDYRALDEALSTSGVPERGDAAPGDTNMLCVNRNAFPAGSDSPTAAYVEIEYQPAGLIQFPTSPGVTWQFGGGLNQIESRVDYYGQGITLQYTYPDDTKKYPGMAGQEDTIFGVIRPSVPAPDWQATRNILTNYPNVIQANWMGYTNSFYWNLGNPATWLCRSVSGRVVDKSTTPYTWEITFAFSWDAFGWDKEVYYTIQNEVPGDLLTNPSAPNSIKTPQHYPRRDFALLFNV